MDLVAKLTPTEDGYQYICVMVDYFTKWCEAFPLKTESAEEVTGCIVKLFYKFGAPKRLLTDQGREFVNKVWSSPDFLSLISFLSICIYKIVYLFIFTFRSTWVFVSFLELAGVYVHPTIRRPMDWWKNSITQFRGN